MKQLPAASDNSLILNLIQLLSHEYNLNNIEELSRVIHNSISLIKKNPQKLHGIRVEKMFGYMAAILGQCNFIKQEDIGFSYVTGEMMVPDYHLILKDGKEFFVEVKNCHKVSKAFVKLTKSYVDKILSYPGVTLDNFKVAIYWSSWRIWTLISIKEFEEKDGSYVIKLEDACVRNRLGELGDICFAAVMPLRLEFITDLSKTKEINEQGEENFTIRDIKIYTGRGLVEKNTKEYQIIFDLILYGLNSSWDEENYVELNNNKPEKIVFEYFPYERNQKQAILGSLSCVITNKYNLITAKNGIINKLQANYEEELFDCYLKVGPKKLDHLSILYQKN